MLYLFVLTQFRTQNRFALLLELRERAVLTGLSWRAAPNLAASRSGSCRSRAGTPD